MSYTRAEAVAHKAAAGATLGDLHKAIKARLETALAHASMGSRTGFRVPRIFDGWLPDRASRAKVDETGIDAATLRDQFPYVIVRPVSGGDSIDGVDARATATVRLLLGTYSETDSDTFDGWVDLMHLVDLIRLDFATNPVLEGTAFEQTGPLTWEIPEEQAPPHWQGLITSTWTTPRPARGSSEA